MGQIGQNHNSQIEPKHHRNARELQWDIEIIHIFYQKLFLALISRYKVIPVASECTLIRKPNPKMGQIGQNHNSQSEPKHHRNPPEWLWDIEIIHIFYQKLFLALISRYKFIPVASECTLIRKPNPKMGQIGPTHNSKSETKPHRNPPAVSYTNLTQPKKNKR